MKSNADNPATLRAREPRNLLLHGPRIPRYVIPFKHQILEMEP
jgi:hypothetical protein